MRIIDSHKRAEKGPRENEDMAHKTEDVDYIVTTYLRGGDQWSDVFASAWEAMAAVARINNATDDIARITMTKKVVTCETIEMEVA